jgi:hypothetical protein
VGGPGGGPRWGCLSLDRKSRFVVAWASAASEEQAAPAVVRQTRERTAGRAGAAWVSDGNPCYAEQIGKAYRDPLRTGRRGRPRLVLRTDVRLTQVVKRRAGGRVVGVEVRAALGEQVENPATSYEERINGVLRDRLNALTRKTHAFAKRAPTWDALVAVCLFERNWLRPHKALRQRREGLPDARRYLQRTPAMAAGLADHVWTWAEFLARPVKQHLTE